MSYPYTKEIKLKINHYETKGWRKSTTSQGPGHLETTCLSVRKSYIPRLRLSARYTQMITFTDYMSQLPNGLLMSITLRNHHTVTLMTTKKNTVDVYQNLEWTEQDGVSVSYDTEDL